MITNDSIKEYYTKLHGAYVQCYDMLKAMTQSLSTKDSEISLVTVSPKGERETVRIPSFLHLENKLEQLDSSLSSLVNLPESGEAWMHNNSDIYKIEMIKNGIAPQQPEISSKSIVALFKDNNFLKDLVSPKTYLKIDISNMTDNLDSVMMKKFVIHNSDMYNALNGYEKYEDIKVALYGYDNGTDYEEYDSVLDVPIKNERYDSKFEIVSIPNSDGSDNPWKESDSSKLSYRIKINTLEYSDSEDSTITYNLKVGDCLYMPGQYTTWKVKYVDNTNMEIIVEEIAGHTSLQNIYDNSSMFFKIYNKVYNDYHYVEVPLEENQYIIIFLSAVQNNTRSGWSSPLFCDLSNIYVKDAGGNYIKDSYGNNLSYIEYYKKYCTNIGDIILSITETAYPQIANFTADQLERLQESDEVQIAVTNTFDTENILQVVPINKHLVDTTSNEEIKKLHNDKNDFLQQISSKQSEINTIYNKLISTDFSKETTISQSSLKTQLDSLYTEKSHLQTQLNNIVDEINSKSTELDVTGNEVKYRVRGVTVIDNLQTTLYNISNDNKVEIIGCEVEYKYKSTNKDNTQLNSINSSTFTDWNRLNNIDRQRKLVFQNNSYGISFVDYANTDNIIKWNQIDIPIQQGEDIIIRIRYKLNVGQPFISIFTPWSDEKTIVFPSQYKSNIDLTTILTQNDKDTVTSSFSKTLIDDGYAEHIQDKIISTDQKFFHTPENIYSGFNTSENKMISLKDKLNDMNGSIETCKTLLDNESNSKFEVYLNYDEYSILLSSNSKNIINIYNIDQISDIFIKKNMNIVIKNTGSTRLNLYSIFPGSTDIPLINSDIDVYNQRISDYERVPMIVNNEVSAQYLGQWIYFRENSAWSGKAIYYSNSEQNLLDETNVSNKKNLEYVINPTKYMAVDNRQVLLGYRARSGSSHSSTISESSVKWKSISVSSLPMKDGEIDWENIANTTVKINDVQQDANETTSSKYNTMINYNQNWYKYGLKKNNYWLMRYEDIMKTSSSESSNSVSYLTDQTTFDTFKNSGGDIQTFTDTNMFVGGFLYPELLSNKSIQTNGNDKSSKFVEVGESVSIPIVFEYYTNSSNKKITKSLYFDIRNSLIKDPIHYMIEITGNNNIASGNISTASSLSELTDNVSTTI